MTARKPIAMANILPTEDEVPQCRKRLLECETLESILLPNGIVNETSPASSYYSAGDISIDSRMSDPLNEDSPATNHENTKETKFHKDSLVFAKLSGHSDPPWPARVAKVCWTNGTHCGYEVFFYGTYQVGIVSKDKVWGYNEDFIAKFSKPKMSAKRKLDFSKGLVEIRDCPDIAPSRDVPESASQIAKKLIRRTAIKDDQKIKGKAMTGIKKVGDKSKNKASSWILTKSNKRLVYDESTDEDCDPIKKKRTLSMNDDSLSSASESKNNNRRRSNRNRKVPYWRRVSDDGSHVDPYSIDQLDEYVKPSASSESLAQNTRKSSSNGKQNKIKVCKNFEDDKKVSKGSDKSISKRRSSVNENNDSTESEEALQNSNPAVNVTRFNPKKRILKADCVIVKEEPLSEDPNEWTVAQTVASIVRMDPTITPEDIKAIREQNIDGCALLKLDFHDFVTYCQVKVGPAIKLSCLVKELKVKVSTVSNGSTML